MKVLLAMPRKTKSARHVSMHPAVTDTTIWGKRYLEDVYADAFHAEAALVPALR